jgi:hypothetical protein
MKASRSDDFSRPVAEATEVATTNETLFSSQIQIALAPLRVIHPAAKTADGSPQGALSRNRID